MDIEAPKEVRDGEGKRQPLREEFLRLLDEQQVELPEAAEVDDGEGEMSAYHKLVETWYTFEPGDVEGYYETLGQAAEDHRALVPIVDELFAGRSE